MFKSDSSISPAVTSQKITPNLNFRKCSQISKSFSSQSNVMFPWLFENK